VSCLYGISLRLCFCRPAKSLMRPLFLFLAALSLARGQFFSSTPLGLDAYLPVPDDDPLTAEKVALGRKLFFDKRLSRDQTLSCASCHDPQRAYTDGRTLAEGIEHTKGERNTPTLVNRGYGAVQFWDGRVKLLEEQVLQPIQNPKELGMTLPEVGARLGIDERTLAQSLASYVRTIRSGNSRVDQYLSAYSGLTPQEQLGMRIFRVKGNCVACHVGPNFTDEKFHNTGVSYHNGRFLDEGRFAVTGKPADHGAFKTPTLREVARTAPYMHDGSLETLEDVVEFYDRGGNPNPYRDPEIRPLHLTPEEKQALIAFLKALSGEISEGVGQPESVAAP
jgi:cytochrome c peroxidase